jgi:hypothetical protein
MSKSDHHKPINFVGLYFIDEERYETGQIIAQISDGYYLAQFDCIEKGAPPPRLEVLSTQRLLQRCSSAFGFLVLGRSRLMTKSRASRPAGVGPSGRREP